MKTKTLIMVLIPAATVLGACSKVSFTPSSDVGQSQQAVTPPTPPAAVCSPSQVKVTRPTRVLFLVDQSGSNVNGPFEYPGEATDPSKSFRSKVMNDFVTTNSDKAHVSWGLSVFNGTTAVNLMKSGGVAAPFSVVNDFKTALASFIGRSDVGNTPYKAAFNLAYNFIHTDMATAPAETAYLIAFITDGYPTDYCPGGAGQTLCPGQIMDSQIDTDLRRIVDLNPRNVKFSTVYYGKPDSDAVSRLQRMATVGLGQSVDANATSQVDLNDILEIQTETCVNP